MPRLNIFNSISEKFYSWTINLLLPPATRCDEVVPALHFYSWHYNHHQSSNRDADTHN
jgi:hypothetical protein